MTRVGLLHPGAMGAAVGAALIGAGHHVLWDPAGRSSATASRAETAGLVAATDLDDLVSRADIVLSVCPPHGAVALATAVAATGKLDGTTFVDANAVSPATAREIGAVVEEAGGRWVDGGIIGPPPAPSRPCRLILSGPLAASVASTLAAPDGGLEVAVLSDPVAASALKMVYAAWTKGTAALLLAIRAAARAEGVEGALVAEWARSSRAPLEQSAAGASLEKGWRWVAEMEEIARTFADVGLPDGFHQAAAEVFRRMPERATRAPEDELDVAVAAALGEAPLP